MLLFLGISIISVIEILDLGVNLLISFKHQNVKVSPILSSNHMGRGMDTNSSLPNTKAEDAIAGFNGATEDDNIETTDAEEYVMFNEQMCLAACGHADVREVILDQYVWDDIKDIELM
jgi:hypothetical protein